MHDNYLNMQHNYVTIQRIFVKMQHNYVQVRIIISHDDIIMLPVDINTWHIYVVMLLINFLITYLK